MTVSHADGCLRTNLENINFLHLEMCQTCEKSVTTLISDDAGVVDLPFTRATSESLPICIAVVENGNVTETWTQVRTTTDCIPVGFHRKSPRRDVVRILQREKETLQTRVDLVLFRSPRLPLQRSESTENIPICVQNHSQSVPVPITAAVKVVRTETIAASAIQKRKQLPMELQADRRKLRDNHRLKCESLRASEIIERLQITPQLGECGHCYVFRPRSQRSHGHFELRQAPFCCVTHFF
jgi:hypothetical protein